MPQYATKKPTDQLRVKTMFVSAVLRETAERIRDDQDRVADMWFLFSDPSPLKESLQGHFTVNAQDNSGKLSMRYLTYFRFLDMPDPRRELRRAKRDGYHNYNQIVFGNLYNFGLPELQYGFTKEVHDQLCGELDKAFTAGKNKYQLAQAMLTNTAEKDRFMAAILSKRLRQGYR